MAEGGSDRAPQFTPEELEVLAEGALAKYPQLYGPGDKQVKAHAKVKIWQAIARSVRTKGVYERSSRHCRKRWEDLRRWTRLTCVNLLGKSTEQKKRVRRTMTPMMRKILEVAYPDLAEQLQAKEKQEVGTLRRPKEEVDEPSGDTQEVAPHWKGGASCTEGPSGTDGEVPALNVSSGTPPSDWKRETFDPVQPPVVVKDTMTCAPMAGTTNAFALSSSARHQFPARRYQARVSRAAHTMPPVNMHPVLVSQEALHVLKDLHAGQAASLGVLRELSRKLDRVVDLLEGLHSAQAAQYSSIPAAGTVHDTETSPPYPHTLWS
ncbi:hypothetical protein NDU88_000608 [Pleurodeles waltl]|uniref:Myb/SANT-like DNA-binding domain-containing protein n=2 Tax=Pleurodeles waltl TaxID=8319 RepID=A0AAV7R4N1_PLEWA|nr:hypothetical protein NDU88_000608 [Pleurodeles waltl]